ENRPTLAFDKDGVANMDCARRTYLCEHSHVGAMVLSGSAEDRVVARQIVLALGRHDTAQRRVGFHDLKISANRNGRSFPLVLNETVIAQTGVHEDRGTKAARIENRPRGELRHVPEGPARKYVHRCRIEEGAG